MAIDEVLELQNYPVWEHQPDEPLEKYLLFQRYFLASPKANLLGAFKRYKTDKGENSQVNNVPGNWRDDCEKFLWRERHQSFWRWKNQSDGQWREEKIREYQAENLDMARVLRDRALEILRDFAVEDSGPKDACQMIRLATELTESALNLGDLDKAINKVFAAGYTVTGEEIEKDLV